MTLRLAEIRDLAFRFVPVTAADHRLHDDVARSWWPAHEIGHFLVATAAECRERQFGLDTYEGYGAMQSQGASDEAKLRYVINPGLKAGALLSCFSGSPRAAFPPQAAPSDSHGVAALSLH